MAHDLASDAAVNELQARDAIGRLITLYGQLLDDLRLDDWGLLFTEEALWRIPSVSFRGRAEIVKGVGGMEPDTPGHVKHLSFTPVIEFASPTKARGWTDMMTLSCPQESWFISAAGRYHDAITFTEGYWRFESREADVRWPPGSPSLTGIVPTPSYHIGS